MWLWVSRLQYHDNIMAILCWQMCVLVAIVTKLLLILIENTETSPESAMANIALSRLQPRKQTAWKTFSSVLRDRYTPALSTPTLVSHYAVNELQQSDGTLMDICIPEEGFWHYWLLTDGKYVCRCVVLHYAELLRHCLKVLMSQCFHGIFQSPAGVESREWIPCIWFTYGGLMLSCWAPESRHQDPTVYCLYSLH